MRFFLTAVLLMAFFVNIPAQSTGFGKPLLWYTVYDPWAMFIDADGPIFAVYESGQVIYWRDKGYHIVELPKDDLDDLLDKFRLTDNFFLKSKSFPASDATDQPSYVLRINLDTLKYFSLYGNMRNAGSKTRMPSKLVAAYDLVTSFTDEQMADWLPDKIEVLLSDYDNSPDQPIPWPTGWPDLSSQNTRLWEGGATLYLDNRHFSRLRRLLASRKEKQAFLISEKKFYAGYRLPLPGVDSVMAANRRQ